MIFGVGTDIIEIQRVEKKLSRTEGLREKIFTSREIEYCESRGDRASHFALRFAAKEAFLKAMGTGWRGGYRLDEIEIIDNAWGRPEAVMYGKVKNYCEEQGITGVQVSLAHIQNFAQAVIVLEKS